MDHPVVPSRTRATQPASMGARMTALGMANSASDAVHGFAELLLERDGPYARAFENLILALIVLGVASVGLEAVPGLPAWSTQALHVWSTYCASW
jgi:hypothetical protein